MANVINYENFNVENIKLSVDHKKYLYSNETYQFKKITPKYVYEDGTEEDIYIQIPEVFSYGIKTFDNNNDQPPSHSFSLVIDVKPNDDDIDEKKAKEMTDGTIKIFEQIQERIKDFLCEENTMKKLGKKKSVWVAVVCGIKPFLSYQFDKETSEIIEGSAPTLFMKLKTENIDKSKNPLIKTDPLIKTVFRQFNSNSEEIDEIPQLSLPALFQGVRCNAIGVVHIESVYIPKMNNVSIQFKLHEVLITEVMKKSINRIQLPQRLLKKSNVDKIFDSDDESVNSEQSTSSVKNGDRHLAEGDATTLRVAGQDETDTFEEGTETETANSKPIIKKVIRRVPQKE